MRRSPEIRSLIRAAFLLRLITLLVSLLGFVDQRLTAVTAAGIIFLALTSLAGLAVEGAPELLQRHPILAALDAAIMAGLMVAVGTDSPLVLVALSSCVIVGVLMPPLSAALAGIVLIGGYLAAALGLEEHDHTFTALFSLPIMLACFLILGGIFRSLAERTHESEQAFADVITGAAASAERARLARELHDSTAKTLQGLALSARSLDTWIDRDPPRATEVAREIASSAGDAVDQLRELLSMLRQDDLALPFHEALAGMARELGSRHGVEIHLDVAPVQVHAPGARYELLVAAKEAITNAIQHSGSPRVWVDLRDLHEDLHLEVRDVGSGFDLATVPEREQAGHFGVRGYAERLNLVGGHADVESRVGQGTRVHFVVPGLLRGAG